jgi:choline dehydrogenase-like flavoprotein
MHIDARQPDNQSVIEGDICIVGAGAAGISIALDWIDSPYKVILLEGGGFEYDDQVQELYNGKLTGQNYYPMKSSRLHYFGGTSMHWGGICSTFDDIDFEVRDWVEHSGWPIKRKDIADFYQPAHNILDLGPYEWDVNYWLKQDAAYMPLPLDEKVVWNKMWHFSPPTRFGTKYKDAVVNAKNIHLYTYANVVNISATDNISSVKSLTIKNHAGKEHTVKARYFILACCSIQNSRLLLASNKQAPAGLGNDHDLVGRYFMEHPELKTGELWLNKPDELKLYRMEKIRAELAVFPDVQKQLKILNGTIALNPLPLASKINPNVKTWNEEDPRKSLRKSQEDHGNPYKKSLFRRIKDRFFPPKEVTEFQSYELYTRIEQAPNPSSRVVLSKEKDALGVPRANLHWAMLPIDKRTVRKLNELMGQLIGAAGIGRVRLYDFLRDENDASMPDFTSGGWHHIGTTRMSDDPKKGVVDANCRVHGIDNLYIAGSSCFTTAGAINPTLTVVAISLRLSAHIKTKVAQV